MTPSLFDEELKWLSSRLRLFYFERYKKYMVVSDCSRRVPGITDYDPITGKNFAVELVLEDEQNRPAPLDRRSLFAVKLALRDPYRRKPFSFYWKHITEGEKKREREAENERRQRFKDAGKDINHMMTARTFS